MSQFLFPAFLLFTSIPSFAWSSKVIRVADGDTITVQRRTQHIKIRLYGIDCPKKG